MNESIVQECRGLILNTKKNFKIISYPFKKFFNYKELLAAQLDLQSIKAYEKKDGSLLTLYYYNYDWNVSTTAKPDADGEVYGYDYTFNFLFWKVWNELNYRLPKIKYLTFSFMFELETPFNRIVVDHKENKLTLIGVRDNITLKEYPIEEISKEHNWLYCPELKTKKLKVEEIVDISSKINPLDLEGYILVDKNYNRIKIKSPEYVALHHLKQSISLKNMLIICLKNEGSELISYFPEYKEMYEKINIKLISLKEELNSKFIKFKENRPDYKYIAIENKEYKHKGILMTMLRKNESIDVILEKTPIKRIMRWLELN